MGANIQLKSSEYQSNFGMDPIPMDMNHTLTAALPKMVSEGDIPEGTCQVFRNGDFHFILDTGDPDFEFIYFSKKHPWFLTMRNTRGLIQIDFSLSDLYAKKKGQGLSTFGFKMFGFGEDSEFDPTVEYPPHGLLSDNHHIVSSCSNGAFALSSQYTNTYMCVASSSLQRSAPAYYCTDAYEDDDDPQSCSVGAARESVGPLRYHPDGLRTSERLMEEAHVVELPLQILKDQGQLLPLDPRYPMVVQMNKNGDAVFRNAEITLLSPSGFPQKIYSLSLTASCLGRGAEWPPPFRSYSLQCYEPYHLHHLYVGSINHTKSGRPCMVRPPISTANSLGGRWKPRRVLPRRSAWCHAPARQQHDERTCGGRDPSTGSGHSGTELGRPHVVDARCAGRAEVGRDGPLGEPRSLGSRHSGTELGRPHMGDARCAGRAEVGRDGPLGESRSLGLGHSGSELGRPYVGDARCAGRAEMGRDGPCGGLHPVAIPNVAYGGKLLPEAECEFA
eukprot:1187947-Prorocentrum_minimum.AAC.1